MPNSTPHYFTAIVSGDFAWPPKPVRVRYDNRDFILRGPASLNELGNVILELPPGTVEPGAGLGSFDANLSIVSRFLSALSWMEGERLQIRSSAQTALFPQTQQGGTGNFLVSTVGVPSGYWLVEPTTDEQRRALGTMREARIAAHPFPAVGFLWHYRALEVCVGWGKQKTEPYINRVASKLDGRAATRIAELNLTVPLGEYVHSQRRNAIAHAFKPGTYDPDDAGALRAIEDDIVLVEAIATIALREQLSVPTTFDLINADTKNPGPNPRGWHKVVEA